MPNLLRSQWFLQYIFVIPLCLPSLFVSNITRFGWTAWLSIVAYTIALACLIWNLFHRMWDGGYTASSRIVWVKWDLSADYRILTDFNTAFFAHPFVPIIAKEMVNPSRPRTMSMTWVAFLVTAIFVFGVPFVGYLLFSNVDFQENIFFYLNPNDVEVVMGKVAALIISICSTAFFQYHIAGIVGKIILPSVPSVGFSAFMASIAMTLPVMCINIMGRKWGLFLYDLGSICFAVLGFVLPPVYFLVQFRFGYVKWGLLASGVLILGLIMFMVSIVAMIQGFINPSDA
jgi:hypothetical protein